MKSLRFVFLFLATLWLTSSAFAQTPSINSFTVKDTKCSYNVGGNSKPCNIGPGMELVINGANFGKASGTLNLCDCPPATVVSWAPTKVVAIVNSVTPSAGIFLETVAGVYSNNVPYNALAPVITSIVIGDCTYVPDLSPFLCKLTPGAQFTVNGSYFGPQTQYSLVVTCTDCGIGAATIVSWNPNWTTSPSPYNNQIVATANQAVCGFTIAVMADTMWSNYVAYTAC